MSYRGKCKVNCGGILVSTNYSVYNLKTNVGEGVEELELSQLAGEKVKWYIH